MFIRTNELFIVNNTAHSHQCWVDVQERLDVGGVQDLVSASHPLTNIRLRLDMDGSPHLGAHATGHTMSCDVADVMSHDVTSCHCM